MNQFEEKGFKDATFGFISPYWPIMFGQCKQQGRGRWEEDEEGVSFVCFQIVI